MNPLGHTRSVVARDHALITPDTFVWSSLPGWTDAEVAIHISPQLGARFMQATVKLAPGGKSSLPFDGFQRFIYVVQGDIDLRLAGHQHRLRPGGYAFIPRDTSHDLASASGATFVLFEKHFQRGIVDKAPEPVVGDSANVRSEPFQGDENAQLKTLLPVDERFDMAVNLFTYQPGATLPQVEIHVMEHGLVMLGGAGVYRLGDAWYPVHAGDVIWMAAHCPQWFIAAGPGPAQYLYYKDVHRDPQAM